MNTPLKILTAFAAALLIAAIGVVAWLVWEDGRDGPVTNESMASSIAVSLGSSVDTVGMHGCVRREEMVWDCRVFRGTKEPGGLVYRATLTDESSCWRARLLANDSAEPAPRVVLGCVKLHPWGLGAGIGT